MYNVIKTKLSLLFLYQLLIAFNNFAANIAFPQEFRCKPRFSSCLSLILLLPKTRNLTLADFIKLFT